LLKNDIEFESRRLKIDIAERRKQPQQQKEKKRIEIKPRTVDSDPKKDEGKKVKSIPLPKKIHLVVPNPLTL